MVRIIFGLGDSGKKIRYPIIQISPELIFGNKIELLSIDFIGQENRDAEGHAIDNQGNKKYVIEANGNGRDVLRSVIAQWYVTLRILAIVGLLSVLIYIGIRIIISSTSQDKSKYKQRLIDWLVAFCILFFMHYIMAGIVNVVNRIDTVLYKASNGNEGYVDLDSKYGTVQFSGYLGDASTGVALNREIAIKTWFEEYKQITVITEQENLDESGITYGYDTVFYSQDKQTLYCTLKYSVAGASETYNLVRGNGLTEQEFSNLNEYVNKKITDPALRKVLLPDGYKYSTDSSKILYFINYARLYVNANFDHNDLGFGFLIMYIVLIVFTTMFAFRYVKRVIYIAFLTLIAPLVALTYPLDKLKDRKGTSI